MQYLIKLRKKSKVAHLWTGNDTVCKMASTGGLNTDDFQVIDETNLRICKMCVTNDRKNTKRNSRPTDPITSEYLVVVYFE